LKEVTTHLIPNLILFMKYLRNLAATILALAVVIGTEKAQAAQGDASFVTVNRNIRTNTRWTKDKVYILTRMIFVKGAVLTIEPGTIVRGVRKGPAGSGLANEPGTLVISRTGKLIANGTPDDPIIFTGISDVLVPGGIQTVPRSYRNALGQSKSVTVKNYAPDGPLRNNGFAHCEEWGGLVVLGRTYLAQGTDLGGTVGDLSVGRVFNDNGLTTNDATFKGADVIEGIDGNLVPSASGPGSEKYGVYGGTNDDDNSGVIRFASIRYCGDVIGVSNELNSLTMGAVGSETVLEHIECTFNTDDGFEWFGGKNNPRFLFSLYNRDDAFDGDEGIRITGQFWTAFQGSDVTPRSGYSGVGNGVNVGHNLNSVGGNFYNQLFEMDGPEPDGSNQLPATAVNVYGMTLVSAGALGGGSEHAIRYRLGATGNLFNGVCELLPGASPTNLSSCSAPFVLNTSRLLANGFTLPSTGSASNEFTSQTNNAVVASQVVSKSCYQKWNGTGTGVDLRLKADAVARNDADGVMPPAGFVQVKYAGSQRDNTHLNGWSNLVPLQVLPEDHPTRLSVTMGLNGSNPTVSFQFAGRGGSTVDYPATTIFVVERSTDGGRTWLPVTTVEDGASGDSDPTVGSITVLDNSYTLASDPVIYRAYAL
jgi:hypothetical protein